MHDKAYDRTPTLRTRELRRNATKAELALRDQIRNRQIANTRFNCQVPIGPYICDFVARSLKLVIEVDGGQHSEEVDCHRPAYLKSRGYRVIRFWNNDVLGNIGSVVATVLSAIEDTPSPTPPGSGRGYTA